MDAARRERRHHRKTPAAAAAAPAGMAPGSLAGTGGGVGGGAAAAARAAYGDVFGGPPLFAAPFAAAPVDYAEVFGGVAAACSIPFLDLPPVGGGDDDDFFSCKGKGDYGEIFARFDFADFALPYEDLFGAAPEPDREPEAELEIASSSGSSRSSIYKESSHLEDEAPVLPQQYQNQDNVEHFKERQLSPLPFHPDTASRQFVMSYNKITERQPDDLVEMTTCAVEPSKEFVIDSCSFTHGSETNHVSRFNSGTMANSDNEKNTSSSSVSVGSPDNDFSVGQKQQSPACPPISGSVSANENHTDSHSTHSSAAPPDYAFLRESDVEAQTQPIKLQPSLRQQPNLLNKEKPAKGDDNHVNHFVATSVHTPSRSNMPQIDKKADINPTSASAAMKEAMDFAEARLKAAKELLERKGDSFKLRKKPSHHWSIRSSEIKVPVPVEVDTSEQKLSMKNSSKEEKNVEDSLSDKHKKSNASRLDQVPVPVELDTSEQKLSMKKSSKEEKNVEDSLSDKHKKSNVSRLDQVPVPVEVDTSEQKLSMKNSSKEEKNVEDSLSDKQKSNASRLDHSDERVLPLEKPRQMMESYTDSCQTSSKIEKLGNWRSDDEFFQLTGDDMKNKTDKTTVEDYNCKRTSSITSLNKDKKNETEFSATDPDLERYEKLWEVNDGMDVEEKHANLRENNTASVDKDSASVILETSTEKVAHKEIFNSKLEGLVTPHDDFDDEYVELPSMIGASTKLDSIEDKSGSLSEAYLSGNDANVVRDLGDSSPNVSPESGTSQVPIFSKLASEVPCDGGMQCTSGSNERSQGTTEVCNPDISQFTNIQSLIQEELGDSYVCDAAPRGLSRVDQEVETYGREKFRFIADSFLRNGDAKIKEVPCEEAKKVKIEEKVGPCAHPEVTFVDVNDECPEESDINIQNRNSAVSEESDMLNIFAVASKLIKRDLDQEISESPGEVDSRMEEGSNGFISDLKSKEAEGIPLENIDKARTEEESTHGNLDMESSESTVRGQSDLDAKCKTSTEEVASNFFSGASSDSTTTPIVTARDEAASSSQMFSHMQHSVQKNKSATSWASNRSDPDTEETVVVCREGKIELPREKSTCEENKNRANKMEENCTTSRIPKAEHGPSPLEKTSSLPKSAESPTTVSGETMKKEALGVRRTKERDNITRTESTSEKEKGSSQRTEEAKESDRKSQKERQLAEERERRKLEEEERERERIKDRLAVERATREAHERAFAEAREKAEKMAFERITAARQRASAEARDKEERASAEARIKAERAAVERATAEARERAIEKAKAEKALAEVRERKERYRSSFKERSTNQDLRQDTQFQRATSSNFFRNPDSGSRVVVVESALRHKARLERHQRTAERVTKALAEKNMRDLMAQREQAEKHRLSEFLDPEIKRWSNGKEGNLRALLSTLQYILGSESGWQPVHLTDLITAAAVKKAYRKATLCVHPDKLQQRGATIRQKYICEKVFDLLKDAWNKFTSEER